MRFSYSQCVRQRFDAISSQVIPAQIEDLQRIVRHCQTFLSFCLIGLVLVMGIRVYYFSGMCKKCLDVHGYRQCLLFLRNPLAMVTPPSSRNALWCSINVFKTVFSFKGAIRCIFYLLYSTVVRIERLS